MHPLIILVLAMPSLGTGSAPQDPIDTVAAMAFIRSQGFRIERLAAARAPYYAAMALAANDTLPSLVVARVTRRESKLIGEPMPLGGFPPSEVQWAELTPSSLLLQVSFADYAEGSVGSILLQVRGDRLVRVFADGPDACIPAHLLDVDGDQKPELIVHGESPAGGDCGEPCYESIHAQFGIMPGWLQVRRWRNEGFVAAENEFPAFYRSLAQKYEAAQEWLTSQDPEASRCRAVYWLKDPRFFHALADRATRLAR